MPIRPMTTTAALTVWEIDNEIDKKNQGFGYTLWRQKERERQRREKSFNVFSFDY